MLCDGMKKGVDIFMIAYYSYSLCCYLSGYSYAYMCVHLYTDMHILMCKHICVYIHVDTYLNAFVLSLFNNYFTACNCMPTSCIKFYNIFHAMQHAVHVKTLWRHDNISAT